MYNNKNAFRWMGDALVSGLVVIYFLSLASQKRPPKNVFRS